jgi:hypothetical protein
MNNILSTEMDVLRRSARKSRMERIKNECINEIIRVSGTADSMDSIEKERLQRYGHVKRMEGERLPKLCSGYRWRERKEDVQEKCVWKEYKQP